MMRKKFESGLKAKVALEAWRGAKTTAQLSSEYGVHGSQIGQWKQELAERSEGIFSKPDHNGRNCQMLCSEFLC